MNHSLFQLLMIRSLIKFQTVSLQPLTYLFVMATQGPDIHIIFSFYGGDWSMNEVEGRRSVGRPKKTYNNNNLFTPDSHIHFFFLSKRYY